MNSFFTQVSSSIRILGWNRDASARATHLKAAGGNVPSATIERKSMSTKTSIKRIALVAAAALALGGFSAVSARAADNSYIGGSLGDGVSSFALANTTLSGIAGPANFVKVGVATGSTGILTISGGTFGVSDSTTLVVNSAGTQAVATAVTGTANVTVPTPTVGTITVSYYKQISAGVYASTATESVVITVAAAGQSGVFSAAKSTIYIVSGETMTAATADATVSAASTAKYDTAAATIQVDLYDALGARYKDTVTATITSGPGVLLSTNDSMTVGSRFTAWDANGSDPKYSTSIATYLNSELRTAYFGVFANGQVGTSQIQIKNAAGTVLATKSVVFAGTTPVSMVVTVKKANVLNTGTTAKAIKINLYDAVGGNEIKGYTGASITGTVATGSTVGGTVTCSDYATDGYYCSVGTPGAAVTATADGTETYSLKTATGTATGTAKINYVSGVVKTVAIAGPASADPGSKVVVTLTATGANGSALPDGDYAPGALLTAENPTANASLTAQPFGSSETITIAAGVATSYTYAPYGGTLSLSWKLAGTAAAANAASAVGSNVYFDKAGFSTTSAATAVAMDDVAISANTEATAAANAATDAANQAADAADNATQAAAEALAAVNTLATTVATLIDGIKSQIKALNTLILQIKKKIKA